MILRLTAAAALLLAVLPAHGQRRGRREAAPLPRVACASGAPEATAFARAAQAALVRARSAEPAAAQALHDSAAAYARAGIAAAEGNPYHHFLLGQAQVALGEYAAADSALRRAVELCPGFGALAAGTRTVTHDALAAQAGAALAGGDTARATAAWSGALRLHRTRRAALSLGTLQLARGELAPAGALLVEALGAADSVADSTGIAGWALIALRQLGSRHYQADRLDAALQLLTLVRTRSPSDAFAAELLAMTRYRRGEWQQVDAAAVLELNPLSENALLLQYHALTSLRDRARAAGDSAAARARFAEMEAVRARAEALPLAMAELSPGERELRGTLTTPSAGVRTAPGTPRMLEFVLFTGGTALPPQTIPVVAPIEGGVARFIVEFPRADGAPLPITGYRYRLLP